MSFSHLPIHAWSQMKVALLWVVAPCKLIDFTALHGAKNYKTAIFVLTAVRIAKHTGYFKYKEAENYLFVMGGPNMELFVWIIKEENPNFV
jgi:hypothetical protein